MSDIECTAHARDMLHERRIEEEWVWRTTRSPDRLEIGTDDNLHYIKAIAEFENRFLRVVVNSQVKPKRIVTLFF